MTVANRTSSRARPCRIGLLLLSATVALAASATGRAGEEAGGEVVRQGTAELRLVVPFSPGKVPVVVIHGLLGSPGNWASMIDGLAHDPAVGGRFQFLTFGFDSLESITESGRQLADALIEARHRFDPEGRDPSFDQVVLVGHSLGGLVAKAAARDLDGQRVEALYAPSDWYAMTRAPKVGRFVFIATPHRGSPIDGGIIRSAGSWVARQLRFPSESTRTPLSSVDELSWEHPFLLALEQARATEDIPFHSIVAALADPSAAGATDGIVPVMSARLRGARSELLVRGGHRCLDQPEVIGEVRRVLGDAVAMPFGRDPEAGSRLLSVVVPPAHALDANGSR